MLPLLEQVKSCSQHKCVEFYFFSIPVTNFHEAYTLLPQTDTGERLIGSRF